MDCLQNVDRGAYAHEVTREPGREMVGHEAGELITLGMRLADREAANCQAVEGEFSEERGALFAQVVVAGALDDSEERLRRITAGAQRPFRPPMGEVHRGLGLR